ncbi:MAG: DUF2141 domain-containing protein [Ignavibacteriaceae bacterium]|jgi:uncharacterized protein (DUF2141 family)
MMVIAIVLLVMLSPDNFSRDSTSIEFGSLTVKVTGFASDSGNCRFALNNSEEIYEREDSVFIGKILPIKNREVTITIDSLIYGTYAVKVFHDENSNGKLDSDMLGIPSEKYGFSNNASGWFGPPSWEKSRFMFNEKEMTIEITVD